MSQLDPAHVLTSEANSGEQYVSEIYGSGGYDSGRDHDPGPVQQRDAPGEWHDRSADPGYGTPEYAQQIYESGDFDPHDDSTWGFTRADAHRWAEHDTADDTQQAAGDGGSARDRQGDGTVGRLRADHLDGHDADIYAILHEDDHFPEPRTRQEAARQGTEDSPRDYHASDAHDAYPDTGNDARGNTPEIAWRNQGNPDSPNGWGSYLRENQDDGDPGDDADHGSTRESEDLWGDTYPDDNGMYGTSEQPGQAPGETLTHDSDADQTARGEHPYPGTGDALRNRLTELEAANAELKTENTQLARGMAELETEKAQLGKTVAEVKAENTDLRSMVSALDARVDRIERAGADDPTLRSAKEQELGSREIDKKRAVDVRERIRPSDEALLFGAAAVGGVVITASDFVTFIPASARDIIASGLAAGAAGIAWVRKRGKETQNADRPED